MTQKAVWISFDLGLKGDYKGLYTFLDNHKAVECGQGLAFLNYNADTFGDNILSAIKADLEKVITLLPSERVYIIWKEGSKIKGEFINGSRRQSPWEGYGNLNNQRKPDSGE